jgi:hypothetical protein
MYRVKGNQVAQVFSGWLMEEETKKGHSLSAVKNALFIKGGGNVIIFSV